MVPREMEAFKIIEFSPPLTIHTCATVTSSLDDSLFAVLVLLSKSSKSEESNESTLHGVDGIILLFNVEDPVPVTTWFVRKAKGGGLAFVHQNPRSLEENASDGKPASVLLAYINADHEYVLFHPHGDQLHEGGISHRESLAALEETGPVGYESIYGELSVFKLKKNPTQSVSLVPLPSEQHWETIFSGSSHNLPLLLNYVQCFWSHCLKKELPYWNELYVRVWFFILLPGQFSSKLYDRPEVLLPFSKLKRKLCKLTCKYKAQSHSMMGILCLSMRLGQRGQQQKGV